jgi:hypothetical protein
VAHFSFGLMSMVHELAATQSKNHGGGAIAA